MSSSLAYALTLKGPIPVGRRLLPLLWTLLLLPLVVGSSGSTPAFAELKESSPAGANVWRAVGLEFDQIVIVAGFGLDLYKVVVLEGESDQGVVEFAVSGDDSGQLIVFHGQCDQSAVSDRVVVAGEGSGKVVVIQIQVSEGNEFVSQIFGEGSRELIAAQIQGDALPPPQFVGNGSRQLIRVDIEILNGPNSEFGTSVGFQFGRQRST